MISATQRETQIQAELFARLLERGYLKALRHGSISEFSTSLSLTTKTGGRLQINFAEDEAGVLAADLTYNGKSMYRPAFSSLPKQALREQFLADIPELLERTGQVGLSIKAMVDLDKLKTLRLAAGREL